MPVLYNRVGRFVLYYVPEYPLRVNNYSILVSIYLYGIVGWVECTVVYYVSEYSLKVNSYSTSVSTVCTVYVCTEY